jgi:AbrB family looped-hinge helix DNA binding protein
MQNVRRFVKVTRRGQTTIPVEVRKHLGIEEGSRLAVDEVDGAVVMRPVGKLEDMAGYLSGVTDERRLTRLLEKSRRDED